MILSITSLISAALKKTVTADRERRRKVMRERLDWDRLVALMWGRLEGEKGFVPANMLSGTTVGLRPSAAKGEGKTVTVTIDGQKISVPEGILIIEAAKLLGIDIPHFCYHPRMMPVGVCRQCLVEVGLPRRMPDGSLARDESGRVQIQWMPKPQTSCTMPVSDGLEVRVKSEEAESARRAITEFLLINHPLDCPVCDRGGECPLQNVAFVQGRPYSRFMEPKRTFPKPVSLSPHILLDRERCIMCKRCIRFCDELAGEKQLEQVDRGWWSYIAVADGEELDTIFSGNVIDICPVGALTSHPYRFASRPWELARTQTVCPKCPIHCTIFADCRFNEPKRFVPAGENFQVNDLWMCDVGRFQLKFPSPADRITAPHLRINGDLLPISWDEALDHLAAVLSQSDRSFFVGSAVMTNEEAYLFQRFARSVAMSPNVDFLERDPYMTEIALKSGSAHLGVSVYDLQQADVTLIAGCDLYHHLPIGWFWVLQAVKFQGARLAVVGLTETKPRIKRWAWKWISDRDPQSALDIIASEVEGTGDSSFGESDRELQAIAQALKSARRPLVLCASGTDPSPVRPETVLRLLEALRRDDWSAVFYTLHHANEVGCLIAGLSPEMLPGLKPCGDQAAGSLLQRVWGTPLVLDKGIGLRNARESGQTADRSVLWIIDPGTIHRLPDWLGGLPETRERWVVSATHWTALAKGAWMILPDLTFLEKNGTYTNWSGLCQKVRRAVQPPEGVRPLSWVLFQLSERMGRPFSYPGPRHAREELVSISRLTELLPEAD